MGLRPLDPATWLDPDPDHPQMQRRREVLAEHRDEVYVAVPGSEAACSQAAHAVAKAIGEQPCPQDDPLPGAAMLVRDDICVLERRADSWILVAGVVCFPSRWRLADKVGRDVVSIHDPVPGYRSALGSPTQRALDVSRPRWRLNTTLVDDPELFQPAAPAQVGEAPDANWYLRQERQCLVPVAEWLIFTIRTDVTPLADMAAGQREAVLQWALTAPPDLAAYRGWRS